MGLIEAFLDHFAPLFNPDNVEPSPIGRALPAQASLHNRPIGEIVHELTGRTREDLRDGLPQQLRLLAGELGTRALPLGDARALAAPESRPLR